MGKTEKKFKTEQPDKYEAKAVNIDSKELLKLLNWLPVQKRVDLKIVCLVFKSLNNLLPSCIQDVIVLYEPTGSFRSFASISLETSIPPNSFVGRAF